MHLLGDIGGTKTRLIFCNSEKDLKKQKPQILATPQNYREFLKLLENLREPLRTDTTTRTNANHNNREPIRTDNSSHKFAPNNNVRNSSRLSACIFGFAGMFDKKKEKLIYAPNLRDFENRNLKRDLEKILKTEVILENDAALAGLGEGKYGAGKNLDVFGYITLSTGVGGVKMCSPRLVPCDHTVFVRGSARSMRQFGLRFASAQTFSHGLPESHSPKPRTSAGMSFGEHKIIRSRMSFVDYNVFGFEPGHSFLLMDNFLVEVEDLLGGENIRKIFGKKPEEIKDRNFWDYYHQILSIFLINVSIFWSVDKVILGGGITKSLDFKKLNSLVNKLHPLPAKIKIMKSKLGEMNVLYGGLARFRY